MKIIARVFYKTKINQFYKIVFQQKINNNNNNNNNKTNNNKQTKKKPIKKEIMKRLKFFKM